LSSSSLDDGFRPSSTDGPARGRPLPMTAHRDQTADHAAERANAPTVAARASARSVSATATTLVALLAVAASVPGMPIAAMTVRPVTVVELEGQATARGAGPASAVRVIAAVAAAARELFAGHGHGQASGRLGGRHLGGLHGIRGFQGLAGLEDLGGSAMPPLATALAVVPAHGPTGHGSNGDSAFAAAPPLPPRLLDLPPPVA